MAFDAASLCRGTHNANPCTCLHACTHATSLYSVLPRLLFQPAGTIKKEQDCAAVAKDVQSDPSISAFRECAASKPVTEECCSKASAVVAAAASNTPQFKAAWATYQLPYVTV